MKRQSVRLSPATGLVLLLPLLTVAPTQTVWGQNDNYSHGFLCSAGISKPADRACYSPIPEVLESGNVIEEKWYTKPDWWVVVFTAALFFATSGLWIFTALLWASTRRAVVDGERALDVARTSATAAMLSAETVIGVELPRLELASVIAGTSPGDCKGLVRSIANLSIEFENHGRTAARIIENCVTIELGDILPSRPTYKKAKFASVDFGTLALPGKDYSINCFKRVAINHAEAEAVLNRQTNLWLFGYVIYSDFLQNKWRQKFCLFFDSAPDRLHFTESTSYPDYYLRERCT